MMKKVIRVFSALSMLLLLMAANCNPEPEPTPPPTPTPDPPAVEASITLSISGTGPVTQTTDGNASAEFSAEGGTASVPFSATVGWTASSSAAWCSVSPTSGAKGSATITLTIAKNETYDERTATVTLKADNATRTVSVRQQAAGGMLVSPKTISAPAEGGDYEIEVQHNVEFTVTVADAAKDWISVVGTKGLMTDKVGIKVKANDDTSVREGTLTIKSTVGEATVTVTQSGKDVFIIEPTEVSLDAAGGTFEVKVTSTQGYHLSSKPDWVTQKSLKDDVFTFEVGENPETTERSGVIVICDEVGTCLPCNVKQYGKDVFVIEPTEVSLEAAGGTFEVKVTSTRGYHLSSKPDWVSQKSLKDDVYTFEAAENPETTERSGVIVICDDEGTCLPCSVKQYGKDVFVIEPTEVSLEAAGGSFEVKVTSTREYHMSSKPDWVNQKSLKDNVYTFEVGENPETTERSGVIVICDDKGTCLACTVKQAGKDVFVVEPTEVSLEAAGGTFDVKVTATRSYHISSKPDWVTQKSLKDNVYTFEAGENPDTKERSGVIVICDDKGTCLACTVKQAGKDVFVVEPTEVKVESAGGTFEVKVTSTREYHLSSKPDWVTQKSLKDNVYTFEVGENPETTERSGVIVICDDKGTCLACTVKQDGKDVFRISPENVTFDAEGGTFELTVTATRSYHLSSKPDWVTQKSVKDNVYTFEVGFNSSDSERSGVIVVCDDKGICLSCTVKQEGVKPFSISPMQVNVGKDGGTFEVKVTSSYGYHLSGKPDWVTEKSVKDKVHTFEVGPSPTSDSRSGAITFCDDKGVCLSMTVRQDGDPYMIDWNSEFYHNPMILSFICNGSYGYRKYRSALEEAFSQMPKRPVLVNVHMWDDFEFRDDGVLTERYSIGYPLVAIVDGRRRVNETYDKDYFISRIKESVEETEANYPVGSAIGFESSVSGQKLDVDVRLYFKLAGSYKVTVFVSESGVIAGQYDDEEEYIEKYRMDDFVRMVMTGSDGDAVSASALSTKKLHYSATIPSNVKKENLKITVAVQRAYGSQRKIVDSAYDYGDYYFDNCAAGLVGKAVPPALVSNAGGGNEDVTNGDPVNW